MGHPKGQREAHNVLSPRYGLALGGTTASFVNLNPATGAIELIGLLGGHAVGRFQSSQIAEETQSARAESDNRSQNNEPVSQASFESGGETH